jgi:hypothetical protein
MVPRNILAPLFDRRFVARLGGFALAGIRLSFPPNKAVCQLVFVLLGQPLFRSFLEVKETSEKKLQWYPT